MNDELRDLVRRLDADGWTRMEIVNAVAFELGGGDDVVPRGTARQSYRAGAEAEELVREVLDEAS